MTKPLITLNGADGGGQLLRSALTLSLITGQPFHMHNIRGGRPKPGLMRQHLTCVNATQQIGQADVENAVLGSTELTFYPKAIQAGDYKFAIGTGGSTTLLLQTLLPALLYASEASTLHLEGGTHNSMAPPFEFLDQCYLPQLQKMGAKASLRLERHGFSQVGGGALHAEIKPLKKWKTLKLLDRGERTSTSGTILHAHIPTDVAERERQSAAAMLNWQAEDVQIQFVQSSGPGSIIMLSAHYENLSEITSSVAQIGKKAESVGTSAAKRMRNFLSARGVVGACLSDQLLLPMALAGKGTFSTFTLTSHMQTHMDLIPRFLPVQFDVETPMPGLHIIKVAKTGG